VDIARKGDNGEPITKEELELWKDADQDIDGEVGYLGDEISTEVLENAKQKSEDIIDENTDNIEWRNNNNDSDEESYLPIITPVMFEVPVLRVLVILYS
jgi:hypothetical protein